MPILKALLIGGIPGVLLGCMFATKVPALKLKVLITILTLILGLQLLWTGSKQINGVNGPVHAAAPAVERSAR
jgi:uncharacterized membrane protein YfcA